MKSIKFIRQDTRATRWLQAGAFRGNHRPILETINVENGTCITTNGIEIRVTDTPEPLKEHAGKCIKLEKPPRVNGDIVGFSEVEGDYPDWRKIVPSGEPVFTIEIDGTMLANIISGENVRLSFYGATLPFEIQSKDKYAVLMPRAENGNYYTPAKEKP